MSLKSKVFQIILRIICAIFLILAIFLSITAVVYSFGVGNSGIFGSNIYLVKTDAFGFLKSGTAVIAKQVPASEIQSANIVIFNLENGKPALAQVTESRLLDGAYSFEALTENSSRISLSQSQVVAKGMSYSEFWGGVISFVVSPLGMLLVAVVPSIIIIIIEFARFAGRVMPQPEIETVKKQYEVPTYAPDIERNRRPARASAEAMRAYKGSSLDDSIGLYDASVKRSEHNEYMESLANNKTAPLYSVPQKPQRQTQMSMMPLSQKKLNEAIAATRAEHELEEMKKRREQVVKDIQKTRGAAIAAEKEFETSEKKLLQTGGQGSGTGNLMPVSNTRTTVMDSSQLRAQAQAHADSQYSARRQPPSQPQLQPPARRTPAEADRSALQPVQRPRSGDTSGSLQRRIQRPAQRLGADDGARQYGGASRQNNTSTKSIPRLDAVLNEDDSIQPYNIEDILAGLDKKSF